MKVPRPALGALSLALFAGGLAWSWQPPRLTLANTALVAAYPLAAPLGRLLAAAGCVLLAALLRGRARLLAAAPALALLLVGLHQARYRVQADGQGLEARSLFGSERLAWSQVQRVETQAGGLDAIGPDGRVLALPLAALEKADRDSLERTIARRLREAAHPER